MGGVSHRGKLCQFFFMSPFVLHLRSNTYCTHLYLAPTCTSVAALYCKICFFLIGGQMQLYSIFSNHVGHFRPFNVHQKYLFCYVFYHKCFCVMFPYVAFWNSVQIESLFLFYIYSSDLVQPCVCYTNKEDTHITDGLLGLCHAHNLLVGDGAWVRVGLLLLKLSPIVLLLNHNAHRIN